MSYASLLELPVDYSQIEPRVLAAASEPLATLLVDSLGKMAGGHREATRDIDPLWQEAAKKLGLHITVPRGWTREARRKVLKQRRKAHKTERERQAKR